MYIVTEPHLSDVIDTDLYWTLRSVSLIQVKLLLSIESSVRYVHVSLLQEKPSGKNISIRSVDC
jgi:hypothetical protein